MPTPKKIFISACETSADKHAAAIIRACKKRNPDIQFYGIGSTACKQAGMDVLLDMTPYSTVGLVEPLRFLPHIISAYFKVKKWLTQSPPDVYMPLDNQGFHLKCCQIAKKHGIRTVYYIAPQEWHWGTEKGGQKVAEVVDQILAIFPNEVPFYEACGANVAFVGHPTTDRVREARQERQPENILAIFPGSRVQEVERLLDIFLEAAKPLCQKHGLRGVVSVANKTVKETIVKRCEAIFPEATLWEEDAIELMKKCRLSILTSGTVSLEHALMGVPHVVAYKFNPVTYWAANTFFKKTLEKIPHMSMANTILNQRVFPELLQDQVTPVALVQQTNTLLEEQLAFQHEHCERLWEVCDRGSVAERVLGEIV